MATATRTQVAIIGGGPAGLLLSHMLHRDGTAIAWEGRPRFFIDTKKFTGKAMMAYGQTAITEDLYAARDAAGGAIIDEAGNVRLHELTSGRPFVTYERDGAPQGV